MVAPTVANPTARGVTCEVQQRDDGGISSGRGVGCRTTFEDCSDRLHYELECDESKCDCIVDGDKLGEFDVSADSACDVDIAQLKVLCGWNPAR
jgi:hypothetical protein